MDHLGRYAYVPHFGTLADMDQGVLCNRCVRDLPLTVRTRNDTYMLLGHAY